MFLSRQHKIIASPFVVVNALMDIIKLEGFMFYYLRKLIGLKKHVSRAITELQQKKYKTGYPAKNGCLVVVDQCPSTACTNCQNLRFISAYILPSQILSLLHSPSPLSFSSCSCSHTFVSSCYCHLFLFLSPKKVPVPVPVSHTSTCSCSPGQKQRQHVHIALLGTKDPLYLARQCVCIAFTLAIRPPLILLKSRIEPEIHPSRTVLEMDHLVVCVENSLPHLSQTFLILILCYCAQRLKSWVWKIKFLKRQSYYLYIFGQVWTAVLNLTSAQMTAFVVPRYHKISSPNFNLSPLSPWLPPGIPRRQLQAHHPQLQSLPPLNPTFSIFTKTIPPIYPSFQQTNSKIPLPRCLKSLVSFSIIKKILTINDSLCQFYKIWLHLIWIHKLTELSFTQANIFLRHYFLSPSYLDTADERMNCTLKQGIKNLIISLYNTFSEIQDVVALDKECWFELFTSIFKNELVTLWIMHSTHLALRLVSKSLHYTNKYIKYFKSYLYSERGDFCWISIIIQSQLYTIIL
ncbi:hypothetical protein VP01_3433g1 [Puccinia sorghi]|uniref:Uncharacterized protein n=1 Tax=Puccinia sorghi TaxID=27349 RepID=A0A0L6UWE2_9BASI|nr:hypothetical protein VP01_3433g1 [Puccinia sorghi]